MQLNLHQRFNQYKQLSDGFHDPQLRQFRQLSRDFRQSCEHFPERRTSQASASERRTSSQPPTRTIQDQTHPQAQRTQHLHPARFQEHNTQGHIRRD